MTKHIAVRSPSKGGAAHAASMGGNPMLPRGELAPECRRCGRKMILFFQFDLEERFGLPLAAGSHLVVMMCPVCNEIPSFVRYAEGILPAAFWRETEGHFFAALYAPDDERGEVETPAILERFDLSFERVGGRDSAERLTVGGEPSWIQAPERYSCACGAPLSFVCQLSENFRFPKRADAPEQPDSFSADDYCLFLGNETYVFACSKGCSPRAIWITVQG